MYWDLLKVDLFRRQIRSNKRLVSFAAITVSLTHPGIFGVWWCIFVNKGGQSSMILFIRLSNQDVGARTMGCKRGSNKRRFFVNISSVLQSINTLYYTPLKGNFTVTN